MGNFFGLQVRWGVQDDLAGLVCNEADLMITILAKDLLVDRHGNNVNYLDRLNDFGSEKDDDT